MPRRERLAKKGIHEDARRLRSIPRGKGGGVAPHSLLGSVHRDTEVAAAVQGAMVLANSTPEWGILLHPGIAGEALVTDATDVAWDRTPIWTGAHTWDDGDGNSPAIRFVGGSNDDTAILYLLDNAVAGDSDVALVLPGTDSGSQFQIQESGFGVIAYVDADGNTSWSGTSHRFGIEDTVSAIVAVSGHATGSDEGGQITLELADDYDVVFNSWNVDANQDDLRFFRSDAGVINAMTAEGQLTLSVAGAAGGLVIGGDAQWYRSAANMMSTPDNVTIETRCFGFLKAQDEDGRIGNGPVEFGEVVAVGGTMEVAPAAALWATVTIN